MTTAELRAAARKADEAITDIILCRTRGQDEKASDRAAVDAFIALANPTAILALLDSHETALASERQRADALAKEVETIRTQAQFLLDRLETHENELMDDEAARDFHGHVLPAAARLRAALTEAGHGG